MKKQNGIPINIYAIQNNNPDEEIQRLENLVRDGIKPASTGLKIKAITINAGGNAIVIRIPKS